MKSRKSFVIAGASNRALGMYAKPLATQFTDSAVLKGVYDINTGRAQYFAAQFEGVTAYDDFDAMLNETRPDCVIVATSDYVHSKYILRALELGYDVFSEKPMTIDAAQCRQVLEAERRYKKKVTVGFNVRYADYMIQLKKMIDEGAVGKVYNIHFEWLLTRNMALSGHGASYYRRWNGRLNKSGGLLVTKATHHFDMVNWILGQRPKMVSAFGALNLYGKNGPYSGPRCSLCRHIDECEFAVKEIGEYSQRLYVDHEKYDGYIIDNCVFADDIDAYDTISLTCQYDGGAMMAYSETATGMYEGFKMNINGSHGRMEVHRYTERKGGLRPGESHEFIRHIDLNHNITVIEPPKTTGAHDGADPKLQQVLFAGAEPELPSQWAGAKEGAHSVLIGAAANVSIAEKRMVDIDQLIGDPSLL